MVVGERRMLRVRFCISKLIVSLAFYIKRIEIKDLSEPIYRKSILKVLLIVRAFLAVVCGLNANYYKVGEGLLVDKDWEL